MVIQSTRNLNIKKMDDVIQPIGLLEVFPLTMKGARFVTESRNTVKDILANKDKRLMVVVGPCSIHDPDEALEYARRLVQFQKKVSKHLFLVMRVYFEKPRTTVGWKGLISDPRMDDSCDMNEGIRIARKLFCDITELEVPIASEMLDPITPQYISDCITWGAIGARTTESPTHRQLVSGLSFPIGFKNGTDGGLQIAIDAMGAAMGKHSFFGMGDYGMTKIVRTKGHKDVHIVLRGGNLKPNYDAESIRKTENRLREAGFQAIIMVDCSHANSFKNHKLQANILSQVVGQVVEGSSSIRAVMVESNINAGSQEIPEDISELKYGVSVTDECVSWEETEVMLLDAHGELDNMSENTISEKYNKVPAWATM